MHNRTFLVADASYDHWSVVYELKEFVWFLLIQQVMKQHVASRGEKVERRSVLNVR
jgi:hypothetical protein